MSKPTILVTNDDGIGSPGLWAVVEALLPLGQILVAAPERQWSGCGRCMPTDVTCAVRDAICTVQGQVVPAYGVDGSPAQAVGLAVLDLAPARPDLVVSGANHGANVGTEVTLSGTVGAALEAAAFGIPAIAVSLEMDLSQLPCSDATADFGATMHFVRGLARYVLQRGLPHDVDVLNLNVPSDAFPFTPWRVTRLSRSRYYVPLPPDRGRGQNRPGYKLLECPASTESDSDVFALMVDREVSITPLSLDMTARLGVKLPCHLELDLASCLGQASPTALTLVQPAVLEAELFA
jgi:5'-nucleotidase